VTARTSVHVSVLGEAGITAQIHQSGVGDWWYIEVDVDGVTVTMDVAAARNLHTALAAALAEVDQGREQR